MEHLKHFVGGAALGILVQSFKDYDNEGEMLFHLGVCAILGGLAAWGLM
jgi:hypothetical protein